MDSGMLCLLMLALVQPALLVNPCSPSPCGPNTQCSTNSAGAAVCRCLPGFFPKPNTIVGCGPQCYSNEECPADYRCQGTRCVPSCQPGACGYRADCQTRNHRAICSCPSGYSGDPYSTCRPRETYSPALITRIDNDDPCRPSPCGVNAQCRTVGGRPVCSCLPGHQGDPYNNCRRGECQDHTDCPSARACQNFQCVSPCTGACGVNADCDVRDHVAVCRCPQGYVGDPFRSCRRFDPNELCSPTPCGTNTNCRVENERPVCSCLPGYQGNPITGCRHECESDSECNYNQACLEFRCKNPCSDSCGENANCDVQNHRAVCSCPKDYIGNPYSRCYPECTQHTDCPATRACFAFKCTDPCANACGVGAECRVQNHKAICSCPKGFTGHPFDRCRPFEKQDLCEPSPCGLNSQCRPGHDNSGKERPVCTCLPGYVGDPLSGCVRGECETDTDCPFNRACTNNECRNPCSNACGANARCEVRNHGAVCSCPSGYTGDPLLNCYPDARYKGRSLYY